MKIRTELDDIGDTLARLKYQLLGIKFELKLRKRSISTKDGYDSSEPRDELGKWTDGGTLVASNASREAECEAQYARDTFICNTLKLRSCWQRAAERYAACLRGSSIPVLRF
jgi:hypothetical protein